MTTRVLVTGATGFVGRHLVARLGYIPETVVIATSRRPKGGEAQTDGSRFSVLAGDLTNVDFVTSVVQSAEPTWVVHLAAQASVAESWRDPAQTLVNNLVAELNLLEAVARLAPRARVLVAGSAEEYGRPEPGELPVGEDTPLRPNSPYGVSKITQDYLALQYHLGRGLDVIRVRPFNLFGPGQDDQFAVASFAHQIAAVEAGLRDQTISVGNLSARRDYTDVRDAVRAYVALLERGRGGQVYNVGGGGVHSMREILDALLRRARRPVDVVVDPARFRPVDVPVITPDVGRIQREVGWVAEISFEQTIEDILDYWRSRVVADRGSGIAP